MRDVVAIVRDTYVEALEYGADRDEAFETALSVIYEVEPELERDDACKMVGKVVVDGPRAATVRSLPPRRSLA
jgi:hypothetical protein